MSNEDGWDRPETFCLYNKEVNFIKVEVPVPDWMNRGDYNAAIQVWADMTSGQNALSFGKILEIWERLRNRAEKSANAEVSEKALAERSSIPATWREEIMAMISTSGKTKVQGHCAKDDLDWALLWDSFQKFFEDNGIPERPYDGPVRTVRDNPQA